MNMETWKRDERRLHGQLKIGRSLLDDKRGSTGSQKRMQVNSTLP